MPETLERTQVGKREDLSDIIALVDARSTPFVSMAPKGKELTNTLFTWQMDNYPSPSFSGVVDGQDVTQFEDYAAGRATASGRVQIFQRQPKVSRLAQNVSDVAGIGRKREMSRAVAKAITMVKRDMESAFCSDVDSQADSGTAPYLTRGLGKWIQGTAQTDLPVNASYLTPAGSLNNTAMAALTESNVQDVLTSIYLQTGQIKNLTLLAGSTLKRTITQMSIYQPGVSATLANLRTYSQDLNMKKIVATIDFLEGDFGSLEIHPSTFLCQDQSSAAQLRRGYVLDMDLFELRYNQRPQFRPLEDQGGGPRGLVDAIAGLCVKNPLGLGKFYATS